jgi:hypothetical protein
VMVSNSFSRRSLRMERPITRSPDDKHLASTASRETVSSREAAFFMRVHCAPEGHRGVAAGGAQRNPWTGTLQGESTPEGSGSASGFRGGTEMSRAHFEISEKLLHPLRGESILFIVSTFCARLKAASHHPWLHPAPLWGEMSVISGSRCSGTQNRALNT